MANDRLERELVVLGRHLELPPTPDVTLAVREALASDATRVGRREPLLARLRHRRLAQVAAAIVLVFGGALVVSPQVRATVTDVLEFAGIELHGEPAPTPVPTLAAPLPGEEVVGLDDARVAADFQVYVPEALGEPDTVTITEGGRVVSLMYDWRLGWSAIVIDEFAGSLSPVYEKYIDMEATPVEVGSNPGFWIPDPHVLVYVDRHGRTREEAARLAGRTLIWQVDGTTLRMEGDFTEEEALAIAASISG